MILQFKVLDTMCDAPVRWTQGILQHFVCQVLCIAALDRIYRLVSSDIKTRDTLVT